MSIAHCGCLNTPVVRPSKSHLLVHNIDKKQGHCQDAEVNFVILGVVFVGGQISVQILLTICEVDRDVC